MTRPVETRRDHEDPALRTRYYAAPYPDVWRAAKEAFRATPGARLVHEDAPGGVLQGERVSTFLRLKDAVTLRVEESETGDVEVHGEAGKERTLRDLLAALDAILARGGA